MAFAKHQKGRVAVSGLRLFCAGMEGHFRKSPYSINSDAKWLDVRQLRRLQNVEQKRKPIGIDRSPIGWWSSRHG